ncbi:MAG TPA: peptidoglycan-binding domain-containing protein [Stellaceae bacterium]|jgi:peptidoglycan hydrolase-like protein with peptidoglycan-binding domain|nr:peptidoglycan-binding domain-containing protein [Stellaceae bacterium]
MYRKLGLRIAALGLPLLLAACGDTTEDRALSGAGIGAASGAVIGAVTGIGPGAGALIGGAVGATAGAVTDSSQVNLGKPVWRGSSGGQTASAYDEGTVRNIQAGLQRLGYDPGPADGRYGPQTETAIRRFQQDNGLPIDGQPTAAVWQQIQQRAPG